MGRMTSALTAQDVTKTYGSGEAAVHALASVSLRIEPGDAVAIMGPSGSGKTTLLHCLAGILRPDAGVVGWRDHDLARASDAERTRLRRTDFGFVFQSGQLLPELPAAENVALPLMLGGADRVTASRLATQWLGHLGLAGTEQRRPGELSGGQQQRVAIARALVTSPGVVFADEPTGALDQDTGHEVMRVLCEATHERGTSLVVVTHDAQVARWCRTTVHMRDGRIAGQAPQAGLAYGGRAR